MPNHDRTTKRNALFAPLFSKKSSSLLSFFTLRVTLVTAKNQHRCWKARYACARESSPLSFPLAFWHCFTHRNSASLSPHFANYKQQNNRFEKNILSLFRDFFTLWVNIYPYTYRGAPMMRAPHFISTFTTKAKPNILNPKRLLNRYSVARYLWEKNFPNEQWLNASLVMTTIC